MTEMIDALPQELRVALEEIAKQRGITPDEALEDVVLRERSLGRVRADGWRLLVEKDGDVRELAEA